MVVAACQPPPRGVPTPTAEQSNRVGDLARDLADAVLEDAYVADVETSLRGLTRWPPSADATRALAVAVVHCAASGSLTLPARLAVARGAYEAMHGGFLARTDVATLQTRFERLCAVQGVDREVLALLRVAVWRAAREIDSPVRDWW